MTAMPTTVQPSTDPSVEEWRDTVLDLAASALQALADGGDMPDDQTLAVIANAADDIRIRDCYLWTIIHEHEASTLVNISQLLANAGMCLPEERSAPLMTLTGIVEGLLGNYQIAQSAIKCATTLDPDYFVAYATQVALDQMQHKFHMRFRTIFNGLTYADMRNGD